MCFDLTEFTFENVCICVFQPYRQNEVVEILVEAEIFKRLALLAAVTLGRPGC